MTPWEVLVLGCAPHFARKTVVDEGSWMHDLLMSEDRMRGKEGRQIIMKASAGSYTFISLSRLLKSSLKGFDVPADSALLRGGVQVS